MNYAEPEIPLYVKENAVVVYAPSPGDFVMQLSSNLDKLMALMEDIASYYNSGQGKPLTKFSLRPGTPCIARYSVDGAWYRARVESVSGNTVGVYFVDYGNQEDVPLSDVQEIMPQFMSLPAQGILCNLMGARPSEGCQWASEMSESFVEMTEGKDLQTVFMQKKGKVVDVIIDDITDPAGVSINEQFGVTFEVLRDALRALHVNTQQVPNTVSSQPLSAYKLPLFSPQTRIKVLVSWFVTPEEFYCQNLSSEKDFKNLMEEIQRSSKELSPLRGEVDIGTAVIAKFPADGVLYRGEIKEQRGAMSYLVEYVDYGNNELVSPSDLWNVEPRFHSLPRHAFLCTLEGVKPVDSNWSRNVKDYIDIFGADNLECEVSELKNGKYSVNLFLGDKSLAAELVKRNLAEELQGPESDTQFDLELLPSQQFTVHIAFIESITKFYVHLDPVVAQGIQDIVAEYVQNTQVQNRFPLEKLEKYSLCLATPDGAVWYRAKILDVTSPRDVLVSFIDYGDTSEVPLDQMLAIPETLADYFPQATECFISGSYQATIDAALEEQFKEMEAQNVIIFVDSVFSGRLGVQVFDLDGMRLEMFKTVIGNPMLMVEPVSPMPVRNYTVDVWVSHVDGPQRLWLQSTASEEQLVKLLDLLHNFYESDGSGHTLDSPEAGHFCAAKSSKDDGWYRAKVQSVHEDSVSVLFIDYGNSEIVPFQNLRELDPSFFTPHMLSLCASLYVVAKDEDECRNYLTELVSEKVFSATFVKDSSGAWLVDLLDGDKSVAQQLIQSGLALTKGSALSLPDTYSTVQLPVGKQCSVYFSYFESPSEFYVQPAYLHDDITNFQKDLNDIAASLQNLEKLSTVGILCAAQFSVDFQWYRALIMDSNIPVVRVRFVDYGNIDEIDITCTPLKILPTELKTQPFFAVRCSLNAASLANNKQVSLVEDLALNQEVVVEIEVHDSGDPVTVSLIPSENVESYLEVATVAPVQQQEVYKEIGEDFRENINDCSLSESVLAVVKEDTENKSLIWHVTTPAEFWIQDNSVSPSLDEMAERLAEAASFPALESIDEGLLCAALFPEDELWYRALILKVINDCACVRYIDYGNSSLSTQLRALPMDLVSLPPLAKCCQLMLPDTIYPRSLEQAETVELRIGANGDPMIVKIKTEEEEAVLLASEDVAELKGSNEVTICHVTSPTSFWVHFTKDMPLLEEIAEKLLLCESCDALPDPAIGSVCAALFPEDEQWYRAEILSCSENGIEVFFIDYGNSSLSTDLRCLPTEVLNIPRVAKHCYLMLPEAWTTWPLAAEEHFLNISGNDSKSFQITILREGNPAGVSLSYDGICVEDEILKDCQLVVSSDHMKSDLPLEVNVNFATERSSTSTETEKLGVIDVCFQKGEKVVISHINSLTDFWIQKIALQGQLDEMAEKLTSAESFSVHFPRLAGLLCAARYDEDLNWYRARIVHCSEQGAEVLFIDYGNKSLCCELRSLPLELAAIPPLAKHCNLVVPENWTEWPQSLEEEFLDIFQDSSKIFELTVLFEGDPSLVSLVHGEVNIENELKKRYEEKNQSCNDDKVVLEGEKSVCDSQESERIFAGTEITSEECDEESVGQQIILEDQVNKEATQEVDGGNLESIDVVDEEITMVETEQEILVIEEVTDATESVAEEGTYSSGEESSATKECHNEISTETENLTEAQTAVPDSPGKPHTTNSDFEEEKSEIDDLVSGKDREENEVMPGTEENQMGSVGIDEEITLVETEQELLVIEELNTVTEESSSPQEIVEECEEINDGDDTSQDASVKENQEDSVGVDEEITLVEGEQVLLVIEELNTVTEESSTAQEIVEECEEINDGDDTGQDASVKENQEDSVGIDEEITLVEGEQELLVIEELNTVTEESSTAQEIVEECEEINDGDDTGQDASVKENQEDSVGVDEEITLVETEQELLVIEELNTVTEESSTAQEIVEECEEINDGDDTGQDASVKENQEDSVGVDEEITLVETEQELLVIEELNTVTEESSTAQEIVEECEEINDGDDTGQDASVKENQEDSVGVDEEITLVEDEQVLLVIEELSSVTENSSAAQGIIEGEPEENYNRDDTIPEKMSTEEVSCASDEETSENLYLRVTDKVGGEQEVIIMGEETQNREDSVDEENIEVDNDERGAEDEIIIEEVSDDVESMLLDTEDKRNGDGFPVNGEETTSFTPRQHRPPESVKNTVSEITTLLKDTEKDIIHITHGKMFPPEEKMLKENSGTSEEKIIGDKSFTNGDAKNHVQTLTEEEITYCAPKLDMPLRSGEVKENGVVCCTSFGLPTRLQQPLQSRRVVKITHALSPKDFWVRYKNKSLLLDDIDLKLTNAQGFDPLLIAVEGTLCVARCSDNEPFQRGKVVGCHELNTDVFFLDSGKTAVCTKLFCLPEGIETTPPLAKHCCLTLPENWNVWPPAADTEFVNIIEDDSQDFELIVLKDGDPAEVSLLLNGVKVESELEKRLTSR